MWREQAEIKLARCWIFIVAWCHSVKVCALAALPFQSQQSGAWTRMWRWCQVQPSQKERAIGAVYWKYEGCCCNFSVGVALKVWFSHAQYMKMTRDEHLLGFKPCNISIHWLIWKLSFLFKQNWFGIDDFLLNFFATFASVLGPQITVTFASALGPQITVTFGSVLGLQVNTGLQPPTRWETFVAGTMLRRREPTKERVELTILSIIAIDITHLTRFALLLVLRIHRYMWLCHVATWG